jgi:branched-chain amino acid transport system permease protein
LKRPSAALAALLFALLVALLAAAPLAARWLGNDYVLVLATRAGIFAIAAVSLQFVVGFAGLPSLGHAAFLGIGAYALLMLGGVGLDEAAVSLPAAVLAAAAFAVPTGWVALRTRGVTFIMITLAFGQMTYFVAESLAAYGGDDGMPLDRTPPLLGTPLLGQPAVLHGVVLALLLGVVLAARTLGAARFGRVLRAARDNTARVAALGYDVARVRLAAYVIAGGAGGLAGWLLAVASGFVSPATLDWRLAGQLLVMVILGGVATPEGAAAGAIGLVLLEEGLAAASDHGRIALGALLLVFALLRVARRPA